MSEAKEVVEVKEVEPEAKEPEAIDPGKIDELSPEEVAKIATGEVPIKEPEAKQEKPDEPKQGEPAKDENPQEKKQKKWDDGLTEEEKKIVRGARKSYYKEVERRKQLEIEYQKKLKEKELELLKVKAETQKPLTEDEEYELMQEDPEAYKEYLKAQLSGNPESQLKSVESEINELDRQLFQSQIESNAMEFAAKIANVDLNEIIDEKGNLNENLIKFLQSEQFATVANYIDERFTKHGIVPTPEDMEAAYLLHYKDVVFAQATATATRQVKEKINNANAQTSPLNSATTNSTGDLIPDHEFENAKPEDLDEWPPEKVAQYEKWVRERTGA